MPDYIPTPSSDDEKGQDTLSTPLPDRIPHEWNGVTFWGLLLPDRPCSNYELYGCGSETWFRLTRTGPHASGWELKLYRVGDDTPLQILTLLWSQMPSIPAYTAPELFALVGILIKFGLTWDDLTRQRVDWIPIRAEMSEWVLEGWPDWLRTV